MAFDKEKIILETARRHFVQYGYAATRMQDIADEADINKAMLHYYFRSKEKLYKEIVTRTLDYVVPKFAEAMASDGDIWERFEHIINVYFNILQKNPDIPIFVLSELTQNRETVVEELKKRASYFPTISGFMQFMMEEMNNGNIRRYPPLHLMLNLMGMTVFPFIAKPIFCTIFDFRTKNLTALWKNEKPCFWTFEKFSGTAIIFFDLS